MPHANARSTFAAVIRFIGPAAIVIITIAAHRDARAQAVRKEPAASAQPNGGPRDFDFEFGKWRVHHRIKRDGHWEELEGTCTGRGLVDGSANVEEHTFFRRAGISYGIAVRAYDAKTAQWAIWWIDARDPHGALDPPVKGRFTDGVGTFYSDAVVDGKPVRTRFVWSQITSKSARWEQAMSRDLGKSWDTNWVMEFSRVE